MSTRIVAKTPGEPPIDVLLNTGETTGSSLAALQRAVGDGYIEGLAKLVSPDGGVVVYVNEEGRIKGMPFNFAWPPDGLTGWRMVHVVVGPAIFTGTTEDGELRNLTTPEVDAVLGLFDKKDWPW